MFKKITVEEIKIKGGAEKMTRVITKYKKYDYVKSSMLAYYIGIGYIIALA